MIDWHAHILPGMDDGSRDPGESGALLQMLAQQGVDTVIATPHFYANQETVEQFLCRRRQAQKQLPELPDGLRLLCGAEVCYYPGISRLSGLEKLCIQDSGLLLLEMPESKWTEFTIRELIELSGRGSMTLILAHIERCMDQQSEEAWQRLYESGILMQVSANVFQHFWKKGRFLSLLRRGQAQLLGSDCHSVALRPPAMDRARRAICKRYGENFFSHFCEQEKELLM